MSNELKCSRTILNKLRNQAVACSGEVYFCKRAAANLICGSCFNCGSISRMRLGRYGMDH